jgi:hypothetical protein
MCAHTLSLLFSFLSFIFLLFLSLSFVSLLFFLCFFLSRRHISVSKIGMLEDKKHSADANMWDIVR